MRKMQKLVCSFRPVLFGRTRCLVAGAAIAALSGLTCEAWVNAGQDLESGLQQALQHGHGQVCQDVVNIVTSMLHKDPASRLDCKKAQILNSSSRATVKVRGMCHSC